MHGFSGKIYEEIGPEITVLHCLWCGASSVKARTRLQTEWLKFLHLIPLLRIRNVYVRCGECNRDMIAKCAFADLVGMNPMTLQHHLVKSQSLVGLVCILLGLLLCWAPMIGLIPSVIGLCYRKQFGPALRIASALGFSLSLLITALGIILLVLSDANG